MVVVGFVSLFVVMGVLLGDLLETLGSILPTLGSISVTLGALLVTFWAPGVHLEPQGARGEKNRYFWRSSPHVWVQLGTLFLFFFVFWHAFRKLYFEPVFLWVPGSILGECSMFFYVIWRQ